MRPQFGSLPYTAAYNIDNEIYIWPSLIRIFQSVNQKIYYHALVNEEEATDRATFAASASVHAPDTWTWKLYSIKSGEAIYRL